jgi:hypothetical protein
LGKHGARTGKIGRLGEEAVRLERMGRVGERSWIQPPTEYSRYQPSTISMGNYEDMTNLNQLKGGDMAHPWEAGQGG